MKATETCVALNFEAQQSPSGGYMRIDQLYEEAINNDDFEEDPMIYLGAYSDFEEWLNEMIASSEEQSLHF